MGINRTLSGRCLRRISEELLALPDTDHETRCWAARADDVLTLPLATGVLDLSLTNPAVMMIVRCPISVLNLFPLFVCHWPECSTVDKSVDAYSIDHEEPFRWVR